MKEMATGVGLESKAMLAQMSLDNHAPCRRPRIIAQQRFKKTD